MELHTMKQLRNEHRRAVEAGAKVSLKVFAGQHNATDLIKQAHKAASKGRSPETKERTRLATAAGRSKTKAADKKPIVVPSR